MSGGRATPNSPPSSASSPSGSSLNPSSPSLASEVHAHVGMLFSGVLRRLWRDAGPQLAQMPRYADALVQLASASVGAMGLQCIADIESLFSIPPEALESSNDFGGPFLVVPLPLPNWQELHAELFRLLCAPVEKETMTLTLVRSNLINHRDWLQGFQSPTLRYFCIRHPSASTPEELHAAMRALAAHSSVFFLDCALPNLIFGLGEGALFEMPGIPCHAPGLRLTGLVKDIISLLNELIDLVNNLLHINRQLADCPELVSAVSIIRLRHSDFPQSDPAKSLFCMEPLLGPSADPLRVPVIAGLLIDVQGQGRTGDIVVFVDFWATVNQADNFPSLVMTQQQSHGWQFAHIAVVSRERLLGCMDRFVNSWYCKRARFQLLEVKPSDSNPPGNRVCLKGHHMFSEAVGARVARYEGACINCRKFFEERVKDFMDHGHPHPAAGPARPFFEYQQANVSHSSWSCPSGSCQCKRFERFISLWPVVAPFLEQFLARRRQENPASSQRQDPPPLSSWSIFVEMHQRALQADVQLGLITVEDIERCHLELDQHHLKPEQWRIALLSSCGTSLLERVQAAGSDWLHYTNEFLGPSVACLPGLIQVMELLENSIYKPYNLKEELSLKVFTRLLGFESELHAAVYFSILCRIMKVPFLPENNTPTCLFCLQEKKQVSTCYCKDCSKLFRQRLPPYLSQSSDHRHPGLQSGLHQFLRFAKDYSPRHPCQGSYHCRCSRCILMQLVLSPLVDMRAFNFHSFRRDFVRECIPWMEVIQLPPAAFSQYILENVVGMLHCMKCQLPNCGHKTCGYLRSVRALASDRLLMEHPLCRAALSRMLASLEEAPLTPERLLAECGVPAPAPVAPVEAAAAAVEAVPHPPEPGPNPPAEDLPIQAEPYPFTVDEGPEPAPKRARRSKKQLFVGGFAFLAVVAAMAIGAVIFSRSEKPSSSNPPAFAKKWDLGPECFSKIVPQDACGLNLGYPYNVSQFTLSLREISRTNFSAEAQLWGAFLLRCQNDQGGGVFDGSCIDFPHSDIEMMTEFASNMTQEELMPWLAKTYGVKNPSMSNMGISLYIAAKGSIPMRDVPRPSGTLPFGLCLQPYLYEPATNVYHYTFFPKCVYLTCPLGTHGVVNGGKSAQCAQGTSGGQNIY